MKNTEIAIAIFLCWVCCSITSAIKSLMHIDGSEINFVVEHNARKGDQSIYGFDELNVDLRKFYYAVSNSSKNIFFVMEITF